MKKNLSACFFPLVAVCFAGGKGEGVIRTRTVEVKDESGNVLVDITAEKDEPDIVLYDSDGDGDGVVVLNKDGDTMGLEVYNKEGKTRLKISAGRIVMFGDDGGERFRLTKEGVSLYDEQGKLIFFFGSNLGLFDESGRLKLRLEAK